MLMKMLLRIRLAIDRIFVKSSMHLFYSGREKERQQKEYRNV